jgi:UDP-N-acetylmuramyl pentapeptide phosphotransferase/UDP-N-acetylglucosamine-1-phosphate transferase
VGVGGGTAAPSVSPTGSAVVAFALTLAATPLVIKLVRRLGIVDHPNDRSSHQVGTPRGGGLAPALGVLAGLYVVAGLGGTARTAMLVAALGFGVIGLLDDVWDVPPLPRLGLQALVAAVALIWLLDALSGPILWMLVFGAGCLLWLVAYVNAFNFMDGINGIAAAQVVVAGLAWWAIGLGQDSPALAAGGAVVAGAALAFLPYNYPRALVFLGDVGSYLFGGVLASLVIVGLRAGVAPEAVLAPLALYLADTGTTLVRRARAGEVWYFPHRSHVYQRLTQRGWSHTGTTAFVTVVMTACSGLGALSLAGSLPLRAAGDTALAAVLVFYLMSPSLLERRRRLRTRSTPR